MFLNHKHEETFADFVTRAGVDPSDSERNALFFILAGDDDLAQKIDSIYNFDEKCIDPDAASKVDLSGGSLALLQIAFNLFNQNNASNLCKNFAKLDWSALEIAHQAIKIRFPY